MYPAPRAFLLALPLIIALASLTACGHSGMPESKVQLSMADPPKTCRSIGEVSSTDTSGEQDSLEKDMRDKARASGANYVRLETEAALHMSGTTYRCP